MKKHKKYSGWIFRQCLPLCIVSPSAVMVHRSIFDHVGLFDETMPACEDYDLWLRIAPHYPIYLIDKPLIIKRGGHDDQQSRTVPALDRLRIQALCKLLGSGTLPAELCGPALAELEKKCAVYGAASGAGLWQSEGAGTDRGAMNPGTGRLSYATCRTGC